MKPGRTRPTGEKSRARLGGSKATRAESVLIDFNGPAEWSFAAVQQRYRRHAAEMRVPVPLLLQPNTWSEGDRQWLYPIMTDVIAGAEAGDRACIELAVELVESSHSQAFGRLLKAKAARALRRAVLSDYQAIRLRRRVLSMLAANAVCREFREYAKLLRALGLPENWRELCATADPSNPFVQRYVHYFERHAMVRPGAVA
jgi:hypothetical protein